MSKYNAKKKMVDWIKFDSEIEAKYYLYLKEIRYKGLILNYEMQPQYIIQPKFNRNGVNYQAITYKADFLVYLLDGTTEVIDIKGMATPEAKMKRKMYICNYEAPLKWIVWNKKEWRDYFVVEKERNLRKRKAKAMQEFDKECECLDK